MEQNINFLRPHLLPVKVLLSAKQILMVVLGLLFVLGIISLQVEFTLKQQVEESVNLQRQNSQIQQHIDSITNRDQPDNSLTLQKSALKQQIAEKQAVLTTDIPALPQQSKPFSELLQQIAAARTEGIWLTKVEVGNLEKPWIIEGQAKRDNHGLIPQYINQLALNLNLKHPQFSLHWMGETNKTDNDKPEESPTGPISFRLQTESKNGEHP